MDDMTTDWEGHQAGSQVQRAAAGIILNDADRAFLYRVLAIHAAAGIEPSASLRAILASMDEPRPADTAAQRGAGLRRVQGAKALAEAFAGTGGTIASAIEERAVRLGPAERACLGLPLSAIADLKVAAALFDGLASLFERGARE